MEPKELSPTDYAVLGLLAEGPTHGFALSKRLAAGTEVGRALTVRRPLVYRALDRLVELGMASPMHTEPGDSGPQRIIHRVTKLGRARLDEWLAAPVSHIRDMRIEFQLKIALLLRSGRSPLPLIEAQRRALEPTIDALAGSEEVDHLELWRQANAIAAGDYLDRLAAVYSRSPATGSGR